MIKINPQETNTLYVFQEASIELREHGSVGINSAVISADESIISVVTSWFKYSKPLVEGQTGGDGGLRTYVLKAHKAGSTEVKTQRIFRGRLEEEHSINILVIP